MEVILSKDIEKLGSHGDTVIVRSGYARNFLIPKGLALLSSPQNQKRIEEKKRQEERKGEKAKRKAELLAAKVNQTSCTISVQAGEEEKLFGSVTREDIEEALRSKDIEINSNDILLGEPIKRLGVYRVPIQLYPEIAAEIKVWVIKE